MTLTDARERRHTLFHRSLDVHPTVEIETTLAADESPSGHHETILHVPLTDRRRAVPGWLLATMDRYGLGLAPDVETDAGYARLVVR